MTIVLLLVLAIGAVSLWGAAYLMSVWHEDRQMGTTGWPLSRILAYLAIVGTIASNWLAGLTLIRLANVPNYRDIQVALTPLTLIAIILLLSLFPILASYLRVIRATGYMSQSERSGLAKESSVQEAIAAARDAFVEANHANVKIATLTEALGHKEDKA